MSKQNRPGVHRYELGFDSPALRGFRWNVVDIIGTSPGPRLAVMSGMHINEVSSIEATLRLPHSLEPEAMAGTISIISVVNWPAWRTRSRLVCPMDDKNINFSFPGHRNGSFSEALADALLSRWADDAVCLVDLHGADLCEQLVRFAVFQSIGETAFDAKAASLAQQFDVDLIIALDAAHLQSPGRSITGRATERRHGAFVEAGPGGLIAADAVAVHHDGVLRLAEHYGILRPGVAPPKKSPPAQLLHNYEWISAPCQGLCTMHIMAGSKVKPDMPLATITDIETGRSHDLACRFAGIVLWNDTNPVVSAAQSIAGIGH